MTPPTTKRILDRFLLHMVKFTSSAANQDKGLKLFQWTLLLCSKFHQNSSKQREGLAKVSSDISFARYLLRFYGLPACLEAIRSGSWGGASKWSQALGRAMAWSMLVYYPLEHVAYLKWTSPHVLPATLNANRFSAMSCRFWLLYLVCEMIQSILHLNEMEHTRKTLQDEQVGFNFMYVSGESSTTTHCSIFTHSLSRENLTHLPIHSFKSPTDDQQLATLNNTKTNTQLQLVRSALFTLPCIEWSLPQWDTHPWLDANVVNSLMWLESVVSMYQSIRSYKTSLS